MEPGTFEDDEDRRTERTVIGAELTGRVNGLRLLIMRGRGCADCEKACDRKRRDGRTAHPNCPFNPLRRHHSRTCNAASVGWRREGAATCRHSRAAKYFDGRFYRHNRRSGALVSMPRGRGIWAIRAPSSSAWSAKLYMPAADSRGAERFPDGGGSANVVYLLIGACAAPQ
jgi:hypothetical protein